MFAGNIAILGVLMKEINQGGPIAIDKGTTSCQCKFCNYRFVDHVTINECRRGAGVPLTLFLLLLLLKAGVAVAVAVAGRRR
jgi:hypothetical protein